MSVENMLEKLEGGHSVIISKEDYEKIKEFIEKNNLPKNKYFYDFDTYTVDQTWFVYNKRQYILYHTKHFFKKYNEIEENYGLYRLF